jgi:hypothetical protein
MDLNLPPGAVAMIVFATLTASLVKTLGRPTSFVGAMAIIVVSDVRYAFMFWHLQITNERPAPDSASI